jgi:hypothetical protein
VSVPKADIEAAERSESGWARIGKRDGISDEEEISVRRVLFRYTLGGETLEETLPLAVVAARRQNDLHVTGEIAAALLGMRADGWQEMTLGAGMGLRTARSPRQRSPARRHF